MTGDINHDKHGLLRRFAPRNDGEGEDPRNDGEGEVPRNDGEGEVPRNDGGKGVHRHAIGLNDGN